MRRANLYQDDRLLFEVKVSDYRDPQPYRGQKSPLSGDIVLEGKDVPPGKYKLELLEHNDPTCEIDVEPAAAGKAHFTGKVIQPPAQ